MAIYTKKVSVGSFIKKGEDIKDGDIVKIANEGKQVEGNFGMQDLFLVKTKEGVEGNVSFNQTTLNGLIDAYGEDSVQWIGKPVKVWKIKMSVAGKFTDVWFFSHPHAEMTEAGFVLSLKKQIEEEIPTIEDEK